MSDIQSTIGALAGGTTSPSPLMSTTASRSIQGLVPKKIDFRADSETIDRIYYRVAQIGCDVVEATL